MVSPDQILDRSRLLLGMLLAVPLGALLVPGLAPTAGPRSNGGEWSLVANTPNPITDEAPTPQDVLARLTGPGVTATIQAAKRAKKGAAAASSEVGSDDTQAPASTSGGSQIAGTPPDAALAAKLRQSQARNAPSSSAATAVTTASGGPVPYATPSIAAYATPSNATHVFPVIGGADFTDDWGGARPGGKTHKGIDLFAATGAPVVAVSDGVLFKVGWNAVGGWRFWLRDRWGNEFYHAHLSAFAPAAREGAVVRAGTVIGFVGNTGDAKTTPPHLHFEIHPGGRDAIPPFQYVSAWPRL